MFAKKKFFLINFFNKKSIFKLVTSNEFVGLKFNLSYIYLVLCFTVYLFISHGYCKAEGNEIPSEVVCTRLIEDGFENVAVVFQDNDLLITVENRRYRNEVRAVAEILFIVAETKKFGDSTDINIILQYKKTPVVGIFIRLGFFNKLIEGKISGEDFTNVLKVSLDVEKNWVRLKNSKKLNSPDFKFDLVIIPNVKLQFGNFKRPVQSNINLIPELNTQLAKGLSLSGQLIIPLQNNFYFDEEGKKVRPGNITINQFFRLKDDVFISATGGFFDKNRAGVDVDIKKYFSNGKWSIGADIGYTTAYSFTGIETDYYEDENYLTAFLNAGYRYEPYDLYGQMKVGYFLYQDLGARFDILRQFGEVEIGFFAIVAGDEINGGFNFAIPIPPRKYTKPFYIRVRPADKFRWEYRAKGFPRSGIIFNTGYCINKKFINFNPDFIKNRLAVIIGKSKHFKY